MPQAQPELKKVRYNISAASFDDDHSYLLQYMEKRLFVQLNGNRKVLGILRGYDVRASIRSALLRDHCSLTHQKVFLNIVLDEAVEEKAGGEKVRLGMVVIRGNSVVMLEVGPHSRSLVLEDTYANGVFLSRLLKESEVTGTDDGYILPTYSGCETDGSESL